METKRNLKPTLIMTYGLPASGKTTWAKEEVLRNKGKIKRINKDDLRSMIDAGEWSKDNEQMVLQIRDELIVKFLKSGFTVIVDDTNLHPKHKLQLHNLANENNADFEVKDFSEVSVRECIKRDSLRPNSVGSKVILQMYNQYLKKKPFTLDQDPALPKAIICDLDGTLCFLNGRDPYNASTCENDLVNEPIMAIIRKFSEDHNILFTSGREGKYMTETINWLGNHLDLNKTRYYLFMRKEGDMRKDSIIKEEIFETKIRPVFNVVFVLDDRNQVVEMWREKGLTCLQVAEGNF